MFSFVYEHFQKSFKSLDKQGSVMGFEGQQDETPQIEATFDFEGQNYTSIFSVLDVSDGMKHVQEELWSTDTWSFRNPLFGGL